MRNIANGIQDRLKVLAQVPGCQQAFFQQVEPQDIVSILTVEEPALDNRTNQVYQVFQQE